MNHVYILLELTGAPYTADAALRHAMQHKVYEKVKMHLAVGL